jgi:hypothetical protein
MSDRRSQRGVMREFRCTYRRSLDGNGHLGPLETVDVVALTEPGARAIVSQPDVSVIDVTEVKALIDWNKGVFNMEETAEILGGTFRKVQHWRAAGLLPECKGFTTYTASQIMNAIEKSQNKA